MKTIALVVAGAAVAAVPAVIGLTGNAAFSERVPIPAARDAAPVQLTASPGNDSGSVDDRKPGAHGRSLPSPVATRRAEHTDASGRELEPGDDRGTASRADDARDDMRPGDDSGRARGGGRGRG